MEGNKSEENLGSIEPREEHLEDPAKSDQPKQQKTVFDDPDDFNVVHPLQTGWQWWIDRHEQRGKDQSDWGLNIKKLAFFDSVEGFWGYVNLLPALTPSTAEHLRTAQHLTVFLFLCVRTHKKVAEYLRTISAPYDCHLFKQGIRPEWEDPSNTRGGRIVLQLASHLRARANFDKLCLDTVLLCSL